MGKHRQPGPHRLRRADVEVGKTDARPVPAHIEQHLAPRIDHQRVTVGRPPIFMLPALRRGLKM